MRKIFIDGGAHRGESITAFCDYYSDSEEYEIFSFEPSQSQMVKSCIKESISQNIKRAKEITFFNKALWTKDCGKIFYDRAIFDQSQSESSTLIPTMVTITDPETNETKIIGAPLTVDCIDLGSWIKENFNKEDHIILKIDIEGAEYDILHKMATDGSIEYVNKLFCEIHGSKCGKTYYETLKLISVMWNKGHKIYQWAATSLEQYLEQSASGGGFYTDEIIKEEYKRWADKGYRRIINGQAVREV
jgi:FkbM family methyltransferase